MIMTNEDIEKAARMEREKIHKELQEGYKKHKNIDLYTAFSGTIDQYAIPLFKAGADWRIKNLWHEDVSKGETRKAILVQFDNGLFNLFEDIRELKGIEDKVSIFAYIEDLLPIKED